MNFKQLVLMNLQALTNFPYIEKDFDAVTDYELLCLVVDHLNEVIKNSNEQNTVIQNLYNAFVSLKDYVDNYFDNLDIQEEIDNKLDKMAKSGELADIIAQYLELAGVLAFNTLNDLISATNIVDGSICKTLGKNIYNDGKGAFYKIRTITSSDTVDGINIISLNISNTLIAELIQYVNEYYDILKNGGFTDGITPNDSIFNTAKALGYTKFYFSQNENRNANYFFTNYINFNDCEIITDEDVIINLPNISNIDSSKLGKYKSNIKFYSRQQNKSFITPSNITDFFNHFNMKNYSRKFNMHAVKDLSNVKLFTYDYTTTGIYTDNTSDINTYYQEIDYNYRWKSNAFTSIIGSKFDKTKYQCVEVETTPSTQLYLGWVNTTNYNGGFVKLDLNEPNKYFSVNGTINPNETTQWTRYANFYNHYLKNKDSMDFSKSMKYKLKNNPVHEQIELYINDIFVCAYPWNTDIPEYMGFGIKMGDNTSDNGFSYISTYEEEITPLNTSLNILLVGDSRCYGYNSEYRIEDVIECGLLSNGVNNVNIDNISVSGWSISNIVTAINNQTLTDYDIVIIATGINDYLSSYNSIVEAIFGLNNTITSAGCYSLICATIPACYDGTDTLANERAEMYYKIENAIFTGCAYNSRQGLVKYIPNIMGNTNAENLIPVCNDGVHPTSLGTIQFAKSIVNEILNLFN